MEEDSAAAGLSPAAAAAPCGTCGIDSVAAFAADREVAAKGAVENRSHSARDIDSAAVASGAPAAGHDVGAFAPGHRVGADRRGNAEQFARTEDGSA